MKNYSEQCPDCHLKGGGGKRCPKHELAMIEYKIGCLEHRKKELLKIGYRVKEIEVQNER